MSDHTQILNCLLSSDSSTILDGVWQVVRLDDVAMLTELATHIPGIQSNAESVELGGMFYSNDRNLKAALHRIQLAAAGKCLCGTYLQLLTISPEKEVSRGKITITGLDSGDGLTSNAFHLCTCVDCGREFRVEEGWGHTVWWSWKALDA